MNLYAMADKVGGRNHIDDLVQHAQLVQLRHPDANLLNVMRDRMKYERIRTHRSLSDPVGEDGRTRLDVLPSNQPSQLDMLLKGEMEARLRAALPHLTARQQEFIRLHFYENWSVSAIAEHWQLPNTDALRHLKARTCARLRTLLVQ